MPKEGTHQYIAKQVQNLFIPKNKEVYLYGSVAPDVFFFDFIDKPRDSDRLHGKYGEATDQIFFKASQLWPSLNKNERAILVDFMAGYLTHVIADRIFHPWVIYWSGGPAQEKKFGSIVHHLLESWLDIEFKNPQPKIKYNSNILALYEKLCQPKQNLKSCAWQHKLLAANLDSRCFLFLSRRQPALLTLSYKITAKHISHYQLADLSTWRHPVSGEVKHDSYQDLLNQVISILDHLFKQIDWQNFPDNDWGTLVGGASLETNLVGVPFSACRFQNTEYFKDLKII